jgi:hypothetical protein
MTKYVESVGGKEEAEEVKTVLKRGRALIYWTKKEENGRILSHYV